MHQAAQAYDKTARATLSPRELEAGLLIKAAGKLQAIKDAGADNVQALYDALYYNRKLWTVLVTSATKPENPLPQPIKQNIANLALFIFNRTLEVQMNPQATKLDVLVRINREIAAGLSGK